jgi:hypothetical protein
MPVQVTLTYECLTKVLYDTTQLKDTLPRGKLDAIRMLSIPLHELRFYSHNL